ncbi:SAV_2336 N-terminal domain-related protein [Streptomyces sp. CA-249302]|uniref:SAV_2336 N-terminal domain-related protein n=1 Tax=Streptomyces sp. CA-249302 TaxID=3240058 RepID=UPI003D8A7A27
MAAGAGRLSAVLGVLRRAGHELDPQEVLDTLWLAGRLSSPADDQLPLQRALRRTTTAAPAVAEERPTAGDDTAEEADITPADSDLTSLNAPELHAAALPPLLPDRVLQTLSDPGKPALPLLVPEEKALRNELVIGRALRPLKQKHPSPWREELDEAATASRLAEEPRLPDVVMRPTPERWLQLVIVIDDGLSMLLWHRLTAELLTAMQRLGAFRSIEIRGIDTRTAGPPTLHGQPFGADSSTMSPSVLRDPSGKTLVLVVSDGMGAAWRRGAMHDILLHWAACGPVAILHTLSPDHWDGSGIQADRWQATTRRPGGANTSWEITDRVLPRQWVGFTGVPIPVLEPTPDSLRAWTRLLTSPGTTVELPLLARPKRHAPITASREVNSVQHFRDAATPEAYRLAAHLAAVSPVSVPVMRLVQSAVPWRARTSHLAEVFLSGLIHPFPAPVPGPLPAKHRVFDFTEECKSALLDAVPSGELLRTSRRIGRRLEELAGRSPDFPAWLAHPEGSDTLPAAFPSFTVVERRLMARFGVTLPSPTVTSPTHRVVRPPIWNPLSSQDPANLGPYALRGRRQGGRTTVYLALDRAGEEVAVRTVRPDLPASTEQLLATEAEALRRMNGRYVPALLAASLDGQPPWIAMQVFPSVGRSNAQPPRLGELLDYTGPNDSGAFDILASLVLGWHLATALSICHLSGLAPADLSPDSVVVLERSVLLTGLSDCAVDGEYHGSGAPPTPEDNVRSLGELLRLISSRPRKPLPGLPEGMHMWQGDTWQPLREAVLQCLSPDAAARPTAVEMADKLARYVAIAQAMRSGPGPATYTSAPPGWKAALPPLMPRRARDTPLPRLGRRSPLRLDFGTGRTAHGSLPADVRTTLTHSRRITLIGAHPRCGRSTTTVVLGSLLTAVRGEPVLAVDGAPGRGDLHAYLTRQAPATPHQLTRLPLDSGYEEIRRHTSITPSGLEILAYRALHSTPSPAYADEYRWVLALAARHYPLVLTDLAMFRLDSPADVVLELTDRLILCCRDTESSVADALRVLRTLRERGWGTLAENAVAVMARLGGRKHSVRDTTLHGPLRERCRAVVVVPFDSHLFQRQGIDLSRLREGTVKSYLDLAAAVAGEPGPTVQRGGN